MDKKAILFGSIGTLVETSELQRQSFNDAFDEAGLDWNWSADEYRRLLTKSGGRQRIDDYADAREEDVDANALHARKTEIFDALLVQKGVRLRPGVDEVIQHAKDGGIKLGFVTATSKDNVDALFKALGKQADKNDFVFIGDASMVSAGKPDPAIYMKALQVLNLGAHDCIAIEDTPISAEAALSASIDTVAYPGAFADRISFADAVTVLDDLTFTNLMESV